MRPSKFASTGPRKYSCRRGGTAPRERRLLTLGAAVLLVGALVVAVLAATLTVLAVDALGHDSDEPRLLAANQIPDYNAAVTVNLTKFVGFSALA